MTVAEIQKKEIQKMCGKVIFAKKGEHLAMMHELAKWLAQGNGQVCDCRGVGLCRRTVLFLMELSIKYLRVLITAEALLSKNGEIQNGTSRLWNTWV